MKQSLKRFISRLLCLVMLLQVMPVNILAEGMEGALNQIDSNSESGMETYSATFNYADNPTDEQIVQAGESITLPDPGGEAVGWTVNGGKEILEAGTEVVIKGNTLFAAADANVWTVTFYNRDGEVHKVIEVVQGEAIGDQMPATIERSDYNAYWAVGTIDDHGSTTIVERIDSSYIPTEDTSVVPDYDKITYTVTFYTDASKSTEVTKKTVDVDTSYCLNDIPAVPAQPGASGKWVYDGGDFGNTVRITKDTDVWAEYERNTFTVIFMVNGAEYSRDTYYSGDALELPSEPVIEGQEFVGWFIGETEYKGGEKVTSDLTINANFKPEYEVSFIVRKEDSGATDDERLHQFFRTLDEPIGTMPENPFVEGKVFQKWVLEGTEEEVTADTIVTGDMRIIAVFETINVYTITVNYWYKGNNNPKVVFDSLVVDVDESDLPYTVIAPASTQTDPGEVTGAPIYYPSVTTLEVKKADFGDKTTYETDIEYVAYTAEYDFVYMLKDLTGSGYTEITELREHVYGTLGSYVTPTVKTIEYANLEGAEGAEITQREGQKLQVKYNRKTYALSYETNGGSYVAGTTALYGAEVTLSTTRPTKDGYTFAGWYLDAALTQPAGSSLTLEKDTTVYAKWEGAEVNYTIVYQLEKYNDSGTATSYVYGNSRSATGTVGSTVVATSAPDLTNEPYREKNQELNAASSVEIAADGSSVLYVYYSLKEYTFYFRPSTIQVGYGNSNVTATLHGDTKTGNNNFAYTMTVKLGQDISSTWPTSSDISEGRYGNNNRCSFYGWQPQGGQTVYVTKRLIVVDEMLPDSGTSRIYNARWLTDSNTYTVNYWLQNADDNNYTRSEEYSQTYESNSGNLSPKDLPGFTFVRRNDSGRTFNFYYDRDAYKIDYFYGSTNLRTISNVKFDANINTNTYNWTPTAAQCNVDSDYTFEGWYSDSGLTTKYTFNTMPASNVVLYAKWTAPSFTVSFEMDGGTPAAEAQTVVKYAKAERPAAPTKEGYTFDGWYTEATDGELFDWNTQITTDTTVYAHWTMDPLSYTVHYVDEEGTKVAEDKTVTNPNFVVDQVVTENAITVAGMRPDEATKSVTLKVGTNEITFVYSLKTGKTHYSVYYYLEGTTPPTPVHDPKENVEVSDSKLSVIELAPAVTFEGKEYFPDHEEQELTLSADETKNVIIFYYSPFKSTSVTVHFVDMNGAKIADDSTQVLKVGNTFTLARTPIAGWELNKAVEGTAYAGTVAGSSYKITEEMAAAGTKEFTLFYQKKVTITAKSASKQYDGTPLKLGTEISDQITLEGIDYSLLTAIDFNYANSDTTGGRLNAGICTVTPKNATITGNGATNGDYYKVRYVSGTLEVTKINVTVRVEPDRWTGAVYNGEPYYTGFTNPSKAVKDYVLISHAGYSEKYLNTIWTAITNLASVKSGASAGLGYYVVDHKNVGDYSYDLGLTPDKLPKDDNYSVSLYVRPGRLQILPVDLTITAKDQTYSYTGAEQGPEGSYTSDLDTYVTVEGLKGDDVLAGITLTGKKTDPGVYTDEIEPSGAIIKNGDDDATGNYKITYVKATLTIIKPIEVDPSAPATTFGKKNVTAAAADGKAKEFSFTLAAVTEGAPMPKAGDEVATLSYNAGETGEKTIPFGTITYTTAGTYEYTITEDAAGNGWTTTGNNAKVTVTITDNGDGTLSASVATATISNAYSVDEIVVNPTDTSTTFGKKNVTAAADGKAKEFSFTLAAVTEGAPVPESTTATVSYEAGATGEKTIPFGEITYTKAGTYEYTITEDAAGAGWTTTGNGAKVTVTITDNGNGTLSASVETATISNAYSVDEIVVNPTDTSTTFGKKNVTAAADGKAKEFSFTLAAVTEGAPVPESTTATVSYEAGATGEKTIPFGEITYTKAGTYEYTITEDAAGAGWTTTGNNAKVTVTIKDNGDGTLSASVATATISNAYAVDEIVVNPTDTSTTFGKKNVTAAAADGKAKEFSFTLAAVTEGAPVPESTTATVSYEAGATGEKTIPFGEITYTKAGTYEYTITEDAAGAGWTTTGNNAKVTVTIKDNGDGTLSASVETATISNAYSVDEIVVDPTDAKTTFGKKNVTATTADGKAQSFEFTLTAVTEGAPMPAAGTATVTYEAGKTGEQTIPFGTITYGKAGEYKYKISETAKDGWTVTGNDAEITVTITDNGDGTLSAAVEETKTITNEYKVDEITVDPTDDEAKTLFGTKSVTAMTSNEAGKEFSFTLKAETEGAPMPGEATATLKYAADEVADKTIPFGEITYTKAGTYEYTITEADAGKGWTTTGNNAKVTVTITDNGDGTLSAEATSVTITNEYEVEELIVDPTDDEAKTLFGTKSVTAMTSNEAGKEFSFTLKAETEGAPMPGEATVTLKYAADEVADKTIPFGEITYSKAGTYEYTITEADAGKGWTTTGNGAKVTVTITDNGDGTLSAEATSVTITNEYKAEPAVVDTATDEGVILVKKVEGEGFKPATFSFTLTAETEGAPMPESATAEATFRAAGSQNVDFGTLTFEKVGIYTYTATETTKGETGDGWTYDNKAYGITIDVTDNGEGQLEAEISGVVTITNTYSSKPELTVEKKATSTPENGTAYQLGETVTYEISVTNTGNVTITDITVSDDLTGDTWTVEKLLPGEKSEAFKTSYTVVQKDVDEGKVLNVATAKGTDPGDKETPPAEKENEVPVQQKHTLLIYYRYLNGAEAAPTYTGEYEVGEAYSVESPVIENFTAMPEIVEGTMPKDRDPEVRYVFYVPTPPTIIPEGPAEVPTYTTIDDYGTPLGLGNITLTAGECFE